MTTSPEPEPAGTPEPEPTGSPEAGPAGRVGDRSQARERTLHLLYEAELKQAAVGDVLGGLAAPPDPFAAALATGVAAERDRIDELIGRASIGWDLDRMPVIDRTVLRMATCELLSWPATPVAVVIDEAVELAKRYSTDESGGFVNGVLSTIASWTRGDQAAP